MEECYLACSGILFDLLGADFLSISVIEDLWAPSVLRNLQI
jgi:hypothetical protein